MVNPERPTFYQLDNYRPEDSVGYLMRLILSSMASAVDTQLANCELTNAQWLPILKLHHWSTRATCGARAGAAGLTLTGVAPGTYPRPQS